MKNKIILIGDKDSKGTLFFLKAAQSLQCFVEFIPLPQADELRDFDFSKLNGNIIKLDPPKYHNADILEVNRQIKCYREFLQQLMNNADIKMLNHPEAVLHTLNKKKCKDILLDAGVRTTPVIELQFYHYEELKSKIINIKGHGVFIKPLYGSGAGGILAYRINPRSRKEVLYTSSYFDGEILKNTKKLRKYENTLEIERFVSTILKQGAIVEEWMQKAKYQDKSYDLRVVIQYGKLSFIVARQSTGPITNLHLNNDALDISQLPLTKDKIDEIEQLCIDAIYAFRGLNVAGIDILLTPNTLTPYIIEMNAQGDLIYKDIYHKNNIYKTQIKNMLNEIQT